MHYINALLSILTILSLELILLLGAVVPDPDSIRPILNGLVAVIDLSLVSSSALLGRFFIRHGSRLLGAVFLLNLGVFIVAFISRISGVHFPPQVLFAADIYWLNLYLICGARNFEKLVLSKS